MAIINEFFNIPYKGTLYNLKIKLQKFHINPLTKNVIAKGKFILDPKGKGRTVQFELDQTVSPDPIIKFRSTHKTSVATTQRFVRFGLNHWVQQRALGINPGSGSSKISTTSFVSRLLKAGHARQPHLKQFKSKIGLSFVPGTIVNSIKMEITSPVKFAETTKAVDGLNNLAIAYLKSHPTISRADFAKWVKFTLAIY